ncbi:GGDEF domain-containing protein [Marinomonas mediterranea]|jgi:diguanylate cyclase (GGDEF) domain|uniref:diguanylate cyclase n=1 Tax=Marinomonas mediterranea (strain ATCC 700492 / JCM 21426 / NBRC 103028 / MMB-1) TaxID=717774 RepID=F2K469_MARM1|nr:GGDEF domain-containing protein [Marinomonas mediterranea]ADZ92510.1 diguanylate cyclase [Marinomonas mediterranea MMB-1]WCN10456.1 diguanylate cyclase [Marinomonas mediterranea]WCN14504.1 diguanylate cyclase [Marinomonas mediterranea]WCN18555.1 diguanylate cyclase [Marinomonas mediterranea MMB-1]
MPDAIKALVLPFLFLLIGILASTQASNIPTVWLQTFPVVVAAVFIVLLGLSWRFNKGRLILVVFALSYPALMLEVFPNLEASSFVTVALLVLFITSLVKEKGFANRFSFNRLLFIGMLVLWNVAEVKGWISFEKLDQFVLPMLDKTLKSTVLVVIEVAAIGVILIRALSFNDRFLASVLASSVALVVMHYLPLTMNQMLLILVTQGGLWAWFLLSESHRMAYRDELTGLASRRALNEDFMALPKHYAIAMVDVDHFKKFNDTYGHDMGDEVLRRVAKILAEGCYYGSVYRYGGEEFSILYRGKKVAEAQDELESIRSWIEEEKIEVIHRDSKKYVSVTASFGLAVGSDQNEGFETLKKADESLYQAKRKGRNRLIIHGVRGKSATK